MGIASVEGAKFLEIKEKKHAGGEVLDYLGRKFNISVSNINKLWIVLFVAFIIAIILITVVVIKIIAGDRRVYGNDGLFSRESSLIKRRRRREKIEARFRAIIRKYDNKLDRSILGVGRSKGKRYEYVIDRLNFEIAGERITVSKFNLLMKFVEAIAVIMVMPFCIFNFKVTLVIQIIAIITVEMLAWKVAEGIVEAKDKEIKDNYFDLFTSIYYNLISEHPEPIDRGIKTYMASLSRGAMYEFCEDVVNTIGTYGETNAAVKLQDKYSEIGYASKTFRLVKQKSDGADITEEMKAFKRELFDNVSALKRARGERNMIKAKYSFYILYIILAQAIITSMSIYLKDISIMSSLMGK